MIVCFVAADGSLSFSLSLSLYSLSRSLAPLEEGLTRRSNKTCLGPEILTHFKVLCVFRCNPRTSFMNKAVFPSSCHQTNTATDQSESTFLAEEETVICICLTVAYLFQMPFNTLPSCLLCTFCATLLCVFFLCFSLEFIVKHFLGCCKGLDE